MSERIQSLLSRAVEDHERGEPQSLAGLLSELRVHLAEFADSLTASQRSDAAAIDALTAEVRETLHGAGSRIDSMEVTLAQRGEEHASLQSSVSDVGIQMRTQAEHLSGLSEAVDGISSYLSARSDSEAARFAAMEQRLMTLQTDMTALGSTVAGLVQSFAEPRDHVALEARIRSIVLEAQKGSERLLAAHIDDSLLALAEALLRPRNVQHENGASQVVDVSASVPQG